MWHTLNLQDCFFHTMYRGIWGKSCCLSFEQFLFELLPWMYRQLELKQWLGWSISRVTENELATILIIVWSWWLGGKIWSYEKSLFSSISKWINGCSYTMDTTISVRRRLIPRVCIMSAYSGLTELWLWEEGGAKGVLCYFFHLLDVPHMHWCPRQFPASLIPPTTTESSSWDTMWTWKHTL